MARLTARTTTATAALLWMLLAACAPVDGGGSRFAASSEDVDEDALEVPESSDPLTDDPDGEVDDLEEDVDVDPAAEPWDADGPDHDEGTVAWFRVECGFFVGAFDMALAWVNDGWILHYEGTHLVERAEYMLACAGDLESGPELAWTVDWTADEFFFGSAGTIQHLLLSTEVENVWFGQAYPDVMTPECDAGLRAAGIDGGGVPLKMTLTDVEHL